MINSRSIDDLRPDVAQKCRDTLARCAVAGIDIIITSTYRDHESQGALYAQGRTKPGRIITNARAGYSFHNYRVAFDVVPMRHGKCVWGTKGDDLELWQRVGGLGESCGLEWAGRWKTFREFPHFQLPGLTIANLAANNV